LIEHQGSIEFSIKYSVADHWSAVSFYLKQLRDRYAGENRIIAVWFLRLLAVIILPVMSIKARFTKLKHVYQFSCSPEGIKRTHAVHSGLVAWSRITASHETPESLLVEFNHGDQQTGTFLIPKRQLTVEQLTAFRGCLKRYVESTLPEQA